MILRRNSFKGLIIINKHFIARESGQDNINKIEIK